MASRISDSKAELLERLRQEARSMQPGSIALTCWLGKRQRHVMEAVVNKAAELVGRPGRPAAEVLAEGRTRIAAAMVANAIGKELEKELVQVHLASCRDPRAHRRYLKWEEGHDLGGNSPKVIAATAAISSASSAGLASVAIMTGHAFEMACIGSGLASYALYQMLWPVLADRDKKRGENLLSKLQEPMQPAGGEA